MKTGIRPGPITAVCRAGAKVEPPTRTVAKGAPPRRVSATDRLQPSRPTGKGFNRLIAKGISTRAAVRKRRMVTSTGPRPSAADCRDTTAWTPQISAAPAPQAKPTRALRPAAGGEEAGGAAAGSAWAMEMSCRKRRGAAG